MNEASAVQIESYVVRIYRRRQAGESAVVGVVEAVASGWQKPFRSLNELTEILARPDVRLPRSASRDRAARKG